MNNINLIGQRFNKLIVIEKAEDYISPKGKHESKWLCKCDCGNEKIIRQSDLRSGRTKSCGRCKSYLKEQNTEKILYNRFKDITGQTFGRLTALYRVGKNKQNNAVWHCKCQCGNETDVSLPALQNGKLVAQKKPLETVIDFLGTTSSAKDEIAALFGDRTAFSTPKPMKLIKEFVRAASEKDSIVLDFFAGSGTTGHAVMDLNKEDGGLRKFILITNNENNICQNITVPRIQKTIEFFNYKETFDFLA